MTVDESLKRFGLRPSPEELDRIRALLAQEIAKESARQGDGDTELMRLCCVQLFSAANLGDAGLIWSAKTASMDADASVDIQLLCGAGLEATLQYLSSSDEQWAQRALQRLDVRVRTDLRQVSIADNL